MDLPSGVVTFLMTDIEGSTRLWDEAPDAMRAALARHDARAATAVAEHAGFLIKPRGEGDSTFSVFARATDAVVAACALQTALTAEPWPEGAPLRVRIAVHTGEADLGVDDYYGTAVNRCARLRSIAHGGQVLVSEATAGVVREMLPEELSLRDLGYQRLRDLAEPEPVSQLLHASLPSDFPALRTIDLVPNNLPYQISTFVGREAEMTKIRELLRETRLLTLTGAGGVGKTRLALQAAAEMLYEYPDGVWLVELAALSDGDLVDQAVATVLDVREEPGRGLAETLVAHLRDRHALLVLDNCEHVVDAGAGVAERLTQQCRQVRILATSREPLRADGETVWRVPSLSVPHRTPGVEPQPEQLTRYAAVRLFIDRATKVSPAFRMTNENAPAVAEICSRLEGVPLAIELAAARANTLSPEQVEQRLDERFRLLTGGRRTALPRQQTLEATVRWSYELLSEAERTLFARLSVFAGGLTLAAAETVCSGGRIEERAVPELLSDLASKSLVIPGQDRCWMLETLRAYGTERLAASGESDDLCARHAAFVAAFAAEAKAGMRGMQQGDWLRRVDTELGNVRAALEWGLRRDPEAGLALMLDLARWWDLRGHWTEGRHWLSRCLSFGHPTPPSLRANALVFLSNMLRMQGELGEARGVLGEALSLARRADDAACAASALNSLGNVAAASGDYGEAEGYYEDCLELRRQQGDRGLAAATLANLGNIAMAQGRYDECEARLSEGAAVARELGDPLALSNALTGLGNLAVVQGDYALAKARHTEALALKMELGDRFGIANSRMNLGVVAGCTGDREGARVQYEQALSAFRELGERAAAATALNNLGALAGEAGDLQSARDYHEQTLALRQEIGDKSGVAASLGELGTVMLETGDVEAAGRLCAQGLAMQMELGDRRAVMLAHLQMGDVLIAQSHLAEGRGHLGEAIRLAVALREPRPLACALLALGQAAHAAGDLERAVRLTGAAESRTQAIGAQLSPAQSERREADLAAIRERLGEDPFAAAWAEGEAMTLEEAVRYAGAGPGSA